MLSRRAIRPVLCARGTYQRCQPEHTVLYRTIAAHLPTSLARTAGGGWAATNHRARDDNVVNYALINGIQVIQVQ